MLAQYDVILFDADRTLFDTEAMEAEALQRLTAVLDIPFVESMPRTYYAINESLWQKIETGELEREYVRVERFRRFMEQYGISGDPAEINRQYLEFFQHCNFLIPDAELVCRTLHQEKRLAIVTNGTASVQRVRLDRSTILPYFSELFISEEVGAPKPQKAFFDAVLTKMGIVDKSRVLIVGDSLTSDIRGGNNAGITACWFNPNRQENHTDVHCDLEIAALRELLTMA